MTVLTKVERQILYSLGQFYDSLNQPLSKKPVRLRTSKIAFIELLLKSGIISKQERALYRNVESLEKKKLIGYEQKMIKFSKKGLKEHDTVSTEIEGYIRMKHYFQQAGLPKRKLQTVMEG